jgi:hypothetical protein
MRTDHQIMSTASNDKWAKAEAGMTAELLPILKLLKADYQAASNIHIPNWKGGPDARFLAELVRMGWRKMEANTLQQRLVVQGETTSATAATDETALRLAALAAEVRGLKDLLAEVRANHGTGGPNERILVELLLMGRRKSKATVTQTIRIRMAKRRRSNWRLHGALSGSPSCGGSTAPWSTR